MLNTVPELLSFIGRSISIQIPRILMISGAMVTGAGSTLAADLVITNARMFAATEADVVEGVNIAVTDGRIESISADMPVTSGAEIIDAAGKTVMPGLVDVHVHLHFDFREWPKFATSTEEVRAFTESSVLDLFEKYLEAGFTSILSPIDYWPEVIEVREQLASGEVPGPNLYVAGGIFVAPGGHYICTVVEDDAKRQWCNDHISVSVTSPDQVMSDVKAYAESGVDMIMYDAVTNTESLSRDNFMAVKNAAENHGLRVLVHNSRASDVKDLVDWGTDGFLHPPSGPVDDESVLANAGEEDVPVTVTIGKTELIIDAGKASPEAIAAYEVTRNNVLELLEAGSAPVYGSDQAGYRPDITVPMVLKALSGLGLSNADTLRAATRDAAQGILGKDDVGTLEPGHVADIIIVNGDPLSDLGDLSNVETVIKAGEVVVPRE